jgi:hypothetical protein
MTMTAVRLIGRCIYKKAFWCCLITVTTCGLVFHAHSRRQLSGEAEFAMISLLSVFEEYNAADVEYRPTAEYVGLAPDRRRSISITKRLS